MTDSSARVLDARLLLSIVAAGIMSFSGVVVETAMNVTFPTLMHEFNYRHLARTMGNYRLSVGAGTDYPYIRLP